MSYPLYPHQKRGRQYLFDIDPRVIEGYCQFPSTVFGFLSRGKDEQLSEFELLAFIIYACSSDKTFFECPQGTIRLERNEAVITQSVLLEKSNWSKGRLLHFLKKIEALNVFTRRVQKVAKKSYTIFCFKPLTEPLTVGLKDTDNTTDSQAVEGSNGRSNGRSKCTDKQSNNYNIKKNIKKKDLEEYFEQFDNGARASELWNDWLEYKRTEHKFKYKTERSEKTGLKGLLKKSRGYVQIAEYLIERSIENTWKGLIALEEEELDKLVKQIVKEGGKVIPINGQSELDIFYDLYPPNVYRINDLRHFLSHKIYTKPTQKPYYMKAFAVLKGQNEIPYDLRGAYNAVKLLYRQFLERKRKVA